MRDRDRDIRRRRHRRKEAKKARIKALIAQSKTDRKKRPERVKEESEAVQKKPVAKIIKPAKEAKE